MGLSLNQYQKTLDVLSKQQIQRAKTSQTIVRLGTYSGKVPAYNASCKPTEVACSSATATKEYVGHLI